MRAGMEKGAVVGSLEGPLATFVGLLYAAQIRISTAQGQGGYRFSCPPESLRSVGAIHQALCSGQFPVAREAQDLTPIAFMMDYPDSLGKRFLPFGRGKAERTQPELSLGVVPLVEGPKGGDLVPASEGWAALAGCRILVVAAELESVSGTPKSPEPGDAALARLLAEAPSPKPKVVVAYSLPDEPRPTKPSKDGEEPVPAVPPVTEGPARAKLGAALALALLPRTLAAVAEARLEPSYFFSWVALERGKGGALRPKRRQIFEAGGVEPEYPFAEFEALVAHLGRLAS